MKHWRIRALSQSLTHVRSLSLIFITLCLQFDNFYLLDSLFVGGTNIRTHTHTHTHTLLYTRTPNQEAYTYSHSHTRTHIVSHTDVHNKTLCVCVCVLTQFYD